jgi:hypothetical protein
MLWANPAVSEPLQLNPEFVYPCPLLGDGSTVNVFRANLDESIAPEDMQQIPQDKVFQSTTYSMRKVELICWEKKVCTACRAEFQFDFIYEYASPALKWNCASSRDDQARRKK